MIAYETGAFVRGFPARFYVPAEGIRKRADEPPLQNPLSISFDAPGRKGEGIRLGDVLKGLDCPNDVVLPASVYPGEYIHLTIKWPGVRTGAWRRKISVKSSYGRTRLALAMEILSQYTSYFAEPTNVTDSRQNSPSQWYIGGKTGIQARDLVLVSLYQASAQTWMVQLAVDRPNQLAPLGYHN
ncbi:hypothetical protein DL96DRAFT_1285357 [Flagelloscypha sp. PMI_526]|nr:hypothetical protein DL96DRAFT_1285357 [Flagelloscypha sp. PMI_526]